MPSTSRSRVALTHALLEIAIHPTVIRCCGCGGREWRDANLRLEKDMAAVAAKAGIIVLYESGPSECPRVWCPDATTAAEH